MEITRLDHEIVVFDQPGGRRLGVQDRRGRGLLDELEIVL